MIHVKHLLEPVEPNDGQRIWVEPIGLTLDLREWCKVDHILSNFGPPMQVWRWYEDHPEGYEYFRAKYHESLTNSPHRPMLMDLVAAGRQADFTLIHQGDDSQKNTATALQEFLSELEAYAPPDNA
jgi:uncharacterized protein YeaO (DUF488 family)